MASSGRIREAEPTRVQSLEQALRGKPRKSKVQIQGIVKGTLRRKDSLPHCCCDRSVHCVAQAGLGWPWMDHKSIKGKGILKLYMDSHLPSAEVRRRQSCHEQTG